MRHVTLVLAAACAAAVPLLASAQFSRPDDAVRYRQGALNVMGAHFSRLGAMAQGKLPWDAKAVTENVAIVETLHTLPFAAFGPETSKSTSKAKPEVWTDTAKFEKARDNMFAAVSNLVQVSKGGDEAATKKAIGETGASCKACHDDFRNR